MAQQPRASSRKPVVAWRFASIPATSMHAEQSSPSFQSHDIPQGLRHQPRSCCCHLDSKVEQNGLGSIESNFGPMMILHWLPGQSGNLLSYDEVFIRSSHLKRHCCTLPFQLACSKQTMKAPLYANAESQSCHIRGLMTERVQILEVGCLDRAET